MQLCLFFFKGLTGLSRSYVHHAHHLSRLRGRAILGVMNHECCCFCGTEEHGMLLRLWDGSEHWREGKSPALVWRGVTLQHIPLGSLGLSGWESKFCALEIICTFPNCAWDSHMIFPTKQLCKQKPVQRWQSCIRWKVKDEAAERPLNGFL